jgi:hypothetical protein
MIYLYYLEALAASRALLPRRQRSQVFRTMRNGATPSSLSVMEPKTLDKERRSGRARHNRIVPALLRERGFP